jgi:hypothetical protein
MTGYTFDQLFDFTRTTAGTFVGSNGLIQNTPASVNLLLYTQDFDIATWNKGGGSVTVTANSATAPDGTSTADTVTESVGGTTHNIYQAATVVSGSAYTWSGYVKANGRSIVQITCQATAVLYVVEFDLTTVTTTNRSGSGSATITAVGNGWYRIVATATSTGAGTGYWQINLCSAANTTNYSGNGTSGIFLWGAQLELGSSATTYTKNFGGVFPARFEYDPVTLQPRGLLVEEQRTNLRTYSQEFDNASWGKTGVTVTANSTTSPDGTVNADSLIEDTATSTHEVLQSGALTAVAHTFSAFVKANGRSWVRLFVFQSGLVGASVWFNVATGAMGTVGSGATNATITNFGNGWYRCSFTFTALAAASSSYIQIATADNGPSSYTGNGTSGLFIYGAQLEAGAFATSYIPTVASQVTRSADLCTITAPMFAPWYNQSAGTFLVEYTQGFGTTARAATVASDGTNSNTVELYIDGSNDAATLPFYGVSVAGAAQVAISFASATQNATHKMGAAYQANDFAGSVDGASVVTDTSGTLPTVNRLSIGSSGTAATAFANGHIRRVTYYPFRASNNQLQALTT